MNQTIYPIATLILLAMPLFVFTSCSEIQQPYSKYEFREDFDKNTHGWCEEKTDRHYMEIKKGHYFIQCKDTSYGRTSTFSLDRTHLYALPENYTVQCLIRFHSSRFDTISGGLVMESTSREYELEVYDYGEVVFSEYDFQKKKFDYYDMETLGPEDKLKSVLIELKIRGWNFEVYANDKKLGSGKLDSGNWDRIAPFAGKNSAVKVEYLYITEDPA